MDFAKFRFGNQTDVGRIRSVNEDYMGYFNTQNGHVFVICDGMGGHQGGAIASQMAVNSIKGYMQQQYYHNPHEAIENAILYANYSIYKEGQQNPDLHMMGTTCVLVLIRGELVYYAHVGDSRIYYYSQGKLQQITKDHSFVQAMMDQGFLTPEQAPYHPRRSEITRALGTSSRAEVEQPEHPLKPYQGDYLLLCTDGLTNAVDDVRIKEVLSESIEVQQKAMKLVNLANEMGGEDNITVQIIELVDYPPSALSNNEETYSGNTSLNKTNPIEFKNKPQVKINTQRRPQHIQNKGQVAGNILPNNQQPNQSKSNFPTSGLLPYFPLALLSIIALGVGTIYFNPNNILVKQLIGNRLVKTDHLLDSTNKKTSILKQMQNKAVDNVIDNTPFLKNMFERYDKVKKTAKDIEDTWDRTEEAIDETNEMIATHKKKGKETMDDIADKYGISVEDLLKANKVKNTKDLKKLDSIKIPKDNNKKVPKKK